MGVCLLAYFRTMYTHCKESPEESRISPGIGVTDDWVNMWVLGIKPRSSLKSTLQALLMIPLYTLKYPEWLNFSIFHWKISNNLQNSSGLLLHYFKGYKYPRLTHRDNTSWMEHINLHGKCSLYPYSIFRNGLELEVVGEGSRVLEGFFLTIS